MALTQNTMTTGGNSLTMFGGTLGNGGVQTTNNNTTLLDTFSKPLVINSLDHLNHQMSQQSLFEKTELLLRPPNVYRQVRFIEISYLI